MRRGKWWLSIALGVMLWGSALMTQAQEGSAPDDAGLNAAGSSAGIGATLPGIAYYVQANAAFEAQDWPSALVNYALFLALNPTAAPVYLERAQVYQALGDSAAAQADLELALTLSRDTPNLLQPASIAAAYGLLASLATTPEAINTVLTDGIAALGDGAPAALNLYVTRAQLALEAGNYSAAIEDLSAALLLDNSRADLYYARALAEQGRGRLNAALADLDQAARLEPQSARPYILRGQFLLLDQRPREAVAAYTRALNVDSNAIQVYLSRAYAQSLDGNEREAATDYLAWMQANARANETAIQQPRDFQIGQAYPITMRDGLIVALYVQGRSGQRLTARAQAGTGADPLLVLVDADSGEALIASDDVAPNDYSAAIRDYRLPRAGNYFVLVSHAGGSGDGTVTVTVTVR
jgi:tetratricopeptide (TPR) repeat protein